MHILIKTHPHRWHGLWLSVIVPKLETMGTCNNCKFWETSNEGKGVCQHKLVGGHKHSNQSDAYTPHEDKIYTGPLFGCVHYDNKD